MSDPTHTTPSRSKGESKEAPTTAPAGTGAEIGVAGGPRSTLWTTESAREARRLRTVKERDRKLQAAEEAKLAHLTARQRIGLSLAKVTQGDLDLVVAALVTRAKGGEEKAINALARLLDQSFGKSGVEAPGDDRDAEDKAWSELTPAEKAAYRAGLIAKVQAERAEREAAGDESDPRIEGQAEQPDQG